MHFVNPHVLSNIVVNIAAYITINLLMFCWKIVIGSHFPHANAHLSDVAQGKTLCEDLSFGDDKNRLKKHKQYRNKSTDRR